MEIKGKIGEAAGAPDVLRRMFIVTSRLFQPYECPLPSLQLVTGSPILSDVTGRIATSGEGTAFLRRGNR